MPLEHITDFANQFWSEPAKGFHIHRSDAPLHTNRLYLDIVASVGEDLSSIAFGIAGITNPDGNIVAHGRQQRGG